MARPKKLDRLTEESNKALAAGMSYGKWKAMQNPTVVEKPDQKAKAVLVCSRCGKKFPVFDNRKRKFCSEKCRSAENDRLKYEWRKKNGKAKNVRDE